MLYKCIVQIDICVFVACIFSNHIYAGAFEGIFNCTPGSISVMDIIVVIIGTVLFSVAAVAESIVIADSTVTIINSDT